MIKKSNFKIKTKIGCLGKQFHNITNFIKLTLYFEYEYSIYDQFLIRNTFIIFYTNHINYLLLLKIQSFFAIQLGIELKNSRDTSGGLLAEIFFEFCLSCFK